MPTWVVVSCATAIALGTYTGGWRIIKTLGTKVVEVRPPQGFGSEAIAATVILASSHVGYPLSTTQVVSGAVTGLRRRSARARRSTGPSRGKIVIGWVLTLPGRGRDLGARLRRDRAASATATSAPIVVCIVLAIGCFSPLARQQGASRCEPEETISENPTSSARERARAGEPVAA